MLGVNWSDSSDGYAVRRLLIWMVRAYKTAVGPFLPPACRFSPTCSSYALEALERYGALKGTVLSAKRICRCHPWNPGGYDPLP